VIRVKTLAIVAKIALVGDAKAVIRAKMNATHVKLALPNSRTPTICLYMSNMYRIIIVLLTRMPLVL